MIEHLRRLSPGILLCIAITIVAILLQAVEVHFAGHAYLEALVLAILLGVALRHGPPAVMAALAAGRPVVPGSYYFRGATFFESGDARYGWITKCIVVCSGEREPAGVKLKFYKVS